MTEASAPRALAAVKGYAAAVAKARRAPQPSTVSLEALKEAGAALSEIRGLEGPEEKRGPRGEAEDGTAAVGAVEEAGPTAASDQAHLEWQMRRAVLFLRRKRWPLEAKTEATIEAQETAACNAICGTALVQMTVDELPAPKADDDDAAWELEVLQGLEASEGAATTTDDMGRKRARLRLAMGLARGHKDSVEVKVALRELHTAAREANRQQPSHRGTAENDDDDAQPARKRKDAVVPQGLGNAPILRRPHRKDFRSFFKGQKNVADAAAKLRLPSANELGDWIEDFPRSITRPIRLGSGVSLLSLGSGLPCADDVFHNRTLPRDLGAVRGVLDIFTFGGDRCVCVVFDLLGAPTYVSKVFSRRSWAFNACCEDISDPNGPIRLRAGTLIPTGHAKMFTAGCVLQLPKPWHDFMCEPAQQTIQTIEALVTTRRIHMEPSTHSEAFQGFRLFLAIAACHARAFSHCWMGWAAPPP